MAHGHRFSRSVARRAAGRWLAVCLGLSLARAAAQGVTIEGQVVALDSDNHPTPVAGALVVARWMVNVPMLVESRTECRGIQLTTTDAEGRYRVPVLIGALTPAGEPHLRAYAPGYEETRALLHYVGQGDGTWVVFRSLPDGRPETVQTYPSRAEARAASLPYNLYLRPFVGTTAQRLEFLRFAGAAMADCWPPPQATQRNAYPLDRALFVEAKGLARSAGDWKVVARLRERAQYMWFGRHPDNEPITLPAQVEQELACDACPPTRRAIVEITEKVENPTPGRRP